MLCLKVASPEYFVVEFVVVFLKKLNCFCVGYMTEFGIYYVVQTIQKSLVDEGIEEVHFFRSVLKYITDHVFEHCFCEIHVVVEVCKCTLWLDHPELSSMTCGVGVLCTEGRSEGVDVAECLCISLAVELSAYSEVCLLAKEVLAVVYSSVLVQRRVLHIQCGYLEHLSCTLTVASCDQWCMNVNKSSLLEEFVDCISAQGTYTEYCLESVCSRS